MSGPSKSELGKSDQNKSGLTLPIDTDVLAKIPLFAGFTPGECRAILDVATLRDCKPTEVILRQEQTSQNLWVLLEGDCEVVLERPAGAPVVLATIAPLQYFGEMSFFHLAPHSASVRATNDVKLLQIARADFDRLVEQGCGAACKLAINVVGTLSERMRRMDEWVGQLVAAQPAARRNGEWSDFRESLFKEWSL